MITNEQLREIYLSTLNTSNVFEGKIIPKVRDIRHWKRIGTSLLKGTRPIDLDPTKQRIFCWSDIHWGHKNIIKYTNRPFKSVEHMNEQLIENYLNVVNDNDVVIFGGDIGFMSEKNLNMILDCLPGYKILIVGNHDMHRNGTLYKLNFNEQHLCLVMHINTGLFEYDLLFTHYPLNEVPKGCICVHGHIHDKVVPNSKKHINMCVEHTNYTPRELTTIIEQANKLIDEENIRTP